MEKILGIAVTKWVIKIFIINFDEMRKDKEYFIEYHKIDNILIFLLIKKDNIINNLL